MAAFFYSLIAWATAGLLQRIIVGAGLTMVVYSGLSQGVQVLLEQIQGNLGGLPADVLALMLLSGIGEAVSILGSAVLSRVALTMAGNVAGFKKT